MAIVLKLFPHADTGALEEVPVLARLRRNRAQGLTGRLAKLPASWTVLHGVPGLDHLVVGPGGVFVVTSRVHLDQRVWVGGDSLTLDGDRLAYIQAARVAAHRATRLLTVARGTPVRARGVLALECGSLFITTQPDDVRVAAASDVRGWLADQPFALHGKQVERIAEAARLMTTWA